MRCTLTDAFGIAITMCATIVVLVVGQVLEKIIIVPIQEQRRVIGRISHAIIFYRGAVKDIPSVKISPEEIKSARYALREIAADIRSTYRVIPCYRMFSALRLVPNREILKDVSRQFERWALFMSIEAARSTSAKIVAALSLDIDDEWDDFLAGAGIPPTNKEA